MRWATSDSERSATVRIRFAGRPSDGEDGQSVLSGQELAFGAWPHPVTRTYRPHGPNTARPRSRIWTTRGKAARGSMPSAPSLAPASGVRARFSGSASDPNAYLQTEFPTSSWRTLGDKRHIRVSWAPSQLFLGPVTRSAGFLRGIGGMTGSG